MTGEIKLLATILSCFAIMGFSFWRMLAYLKLNPRDFESGGFPHSLKILLGGFAVVGAVVFGYFNFA